jgi:hypothetical protein
MLVQLENGNFINVAQIQMVMDHYVIFASQYYFRWFRMKVQNDFIKLTDTELENVLSAMTIFRSDLNG